MPGTKRMPVRHYTLDPSLPEPLHQQLFASVRADVLSGRLTPGQPLPSSRAWAESLGISRTTVLTAIDQLHAEGYTESRPGAAVRISRRLPDDLLRRPATRRQPNPPDKPPPVDPVAWQSPRHFGVPRAFQIAVPALDAFPHATWGRLTAAVWRRPLPELLNYPRPGGYPPLRQAIAEYLTAERGVRCSADQVLITAGSQQALQLAARVLAREGQTVWMEDPGYYAARLAFEQAKAVVQPVPVDHDGLSVEAGQQLAPSAALVYLTPSHQCPLGVRLSLDRRLALLDWASRTGAWVIEDDYDSEYRYRGRPLATLHALDHGRQVIHIGSFSLLLYPALRIGYMVVPESLVDPLMAARALADWNSPAIEQAVLAEFIGQGHLMRHLRRMRALYAERQQFFLREASRMTGKWLEFDSPAAGMHVVGWLRRHSERQVVEAADERGVSLRPLSMYAMNPPARPGLLFGFAAWDESAIRAGLTLLRNAFLATAPRS